MPFIRESESNGNKTLSVNFGVKESDNSTAFVELFGMKSDTIYTMTTDSEKFEVDWDERDEPAIVAKVANYRKFTVDLGDECGGNKDFVAPYDAVKHLEKWLPKFDGRLCVTGQFVIEPYNGKWYNKFKIQNVYAANPKEKNGFYIDIELHYNKSSLDTSDMKNGKKIYLDAYLNQYMYKDKANKYVPIQAVLDISKMDTKDEVHKRNFDYLMMFLKVKNKTMGRLGWKAKLLRGPEEAEFDESMLTDLQRLSIELGRSKIEDYKKTVYGENIDEIRLYDPNIRDYGEGIIDMEITFEEFETDICTNAPKTEKLVESNNDDDTDDDDDANRDLEELFG